MKIIILGAGQVGKTVAESMATEENDITVVDLQPGLLTELQQRLDIRTVVGHASHPSVLYRAGIEDADLIFAVTNDDETNMIACQVAYSLFKTPLRLARVRSFDYLDQPQLFKPTGMPVDFVINPEQMVTKMMQHLIEYPGSLEVFDIAAEKAQMLGVRVQQGAPLVGSKISDLSGWVGISKTRIAALFRKGQAIPPTGDLVFNAEDEVYFVAARRDVKRVLSGFYTADLTRRRIIIAGGGNLGKRLAEIIEPDHHVKIIERDPARCWQLAGSLRSTIVLTGDSTDPEFLKAQGIEDADVFCAMTNADKTNIVSAMLAKHLGAHKTLAIVNNHAHASIAEQSSIDIAISPSQVTIGAILSHMRRGDIVNVYSLRHGTAEVIELIAHGDRTKSQAVGRAIRDLPFGDEVSICAILRQNTLLIPNGETVIETDDQVIIFMADKAHVEKVERLFRVATSFI